MDENGIKELSGFQRDNYADFLKYSLIWFVVLGHFLSFCQYKSGFGGGLYSFIYAFHMPLFVFVSGYFSKHISYRQKNIDTLIYPFVLFQLLTILYSKIIPYFPIKESFFYPNNQLWYLLALFWWRTFVPYRIFFKRNLVIIAAFIVSLSVGFFQDLNGFLGLFKTAYFLPFFLLGVYLNDLGTFVEKLQLRKWLWIISFVLITVTIFILCADQHALHYVNYGFKASLGYEGNIYNIIARIIAMVVSLIMCPAVLLVFKLLYNFVNNRYIVCCISGGGDDVGFLRARVHQSSINASVFTL